MKMFGMFRVVFLCLITLTGCSTQLKVEQTDSKSGYFPTDRRAKVVLSKSFDLDRRKALVLVSDSEFAHGQMTEIGYFDHVITFADLEKQLIANKLTDKVATLRDRIGIHNAARNYKPFLWFRYRSTGTGVDRYAQYVLTDPLTMEDLLVVETPLSFWVGNVNDQNNWYPMYNALIDYIKENSKTFRK